MMLQRKPLELSQKFEEPNNTIPHQTNDTLKKRQKTYLKIAEALARIIYLIGKQGIAYRGTKEKADKVTLQEILDIF